MTEDLKSSSLKDRYADDGQWRDDFRHLFSVAGWYQNRPEIAKAVGVSKLTIDRWLAEEDIPRGINRRRNIIRALARYIAEME